jgi:hypothetical protein
VDVRLAARASLSGEGPEAAARLVITLSHEGLSPFADLALRLTLPEAFRPLAGQAPTGALDLAAGLWRLPTLAPNEVLTLTLTGLVARGAGGDSPGDLALSLSAAGGAPLARLVAPFLPAPAPGAGDPPPPAFGTLGPTALTLSGGAGFDSVILPFAHATATVTAQDGGVRIEGGARPLLAREVEAFHFSDGALFDLPPAATQVAGLYTDLLGRAPEAAGLAFWLQAAESLPLAALARGVVASEEFSGRIAALSAPEAVTALYRGLIERAPEAPELAFWTAAFSRDASLADLAAALADSAAYAALVGQRQAAALWFDGF